MAQIVYGPSTNPINIKVNTPGYFLPAPLAASEYVKLINSGGGNTACIFGAGQKIQRDWLLGVPKAAGVLVPSLEMTNRIHPLPIQNPTQSCIEGNPSACAGLPWPAEFPVRGSGMNPEEEWMYAGARWGMRIRGLADVCRFTNILARWTTKEHGMYLDYIGVAGDIGGTSVLEIDNCVFEYCAAQAIQIVMREDSMDTLQVFQENLPGSWEGRKHIHHNIVRYCGLSPHGEGRAGFAFTVFGPQAKSGSPPFLPGGKTEIPHHVEINDNLLIHNHITGGGWGGWLQNSEPGALNFKQNRSLHYHNNTIKYSWMGNRPLLRIERAAKPADGGYILVENNQINNGLTGIGPVQNEGDHSIDIIGHPGSFDMNVVWRNNVSDAGKQRVNIKVWDPEAGSSGLGVDPPGGPISFDTSDDFT